MKKKTIHKICRRFQEDLWGTLSFSNFNSKTLDFIFMCYVNQPLNKKIIISKGWQNLDLFKNKNINFDYKTKDSQDNLLLKKKSTIKVQRYLNSLKLRNFYGGLGGLSRFNYQLKKFLINIA